MLISSTSAASSGCFGVADGFALGPRCEQRPVRVGVRRALRSAKETHAIGPREYQCSGLGQTTLSAC
jgi:hypothetical protein